MLLNDDDSAALPLLPRLAASREVLFLGGKGGVGKTTLASATALAAAREDRRVLLVSTDPAHNLGHLWQREIGDRRTELMGGLPGRLEGVEIDPAATTARHLEEVGRTLRSLMPAHLAGEVDRHLQLSRDAPGTHEAAVLERMTELIAEGRERGDLVVLDTAPSGHTARLLALPEIMTAWMEGLLRRREDVERLGAAERGLERRPARRRDRHAAGILGGQADPRAERDAEIRSVLLRRRDRLAGLREVLTDPGASSFAIVLTAERLPVLESIALHEELGGLGIEVGGLVVNRRSPADRGDFLAARRAVEEEHLVHLRAALPAAAVQEVPLGERDVLGAEAVGELATLLGASPAPGP